MFSTPWSRISFVITAGLFLKFAPPLLWLSDRWYPPETWGFLVPYLTGTAIYLWGCTLLALAKRRDALWGATGLLCVCALPILISLENRADANLTSRKR
jgi:hypothetical protein